MIRAVVFDFNGLIVDDEHLHFLLFAEQLATQDVILTEELYAARYLGYDDRGCFSVALADHGKPCGEAILKTLIDRKAKRYLDTARDSLKFFPGLTDCVDRLASAGIALAVCSGALRAEVRLGLEISGIADRFLGIVAAEDTAACKPDPEGYLKAFDLLRLTIPDLEPAQVTAVEDSLAGIAAAKSAGFHVVGIPNSYPVETLIEASPSAVVPDLGAFADWVLQRSAAPSA